jgi:hypothetical protein
MGKKEDDPNEKLVTTCVLAEISAVQSLPPFPRIEIRPLLVPC